MSRRQSNRGGRRPGSDGRPGRLELCVSSGSCRRKGRGEGRLATVSPPGSPLSSRSTQLRLCHLDSHAELFLAEWRISSLASSGPSITATAFIFAKPRSRHPQLLV